MSESQNIEYKESWRDEYLKWICGFANAQGGSIFIGIDDSGNVVGVKNCKKLMEDIPNKIQAGLGIVADVNKKTKGGLDYIEIADKVIDLIYIKYLKAKITYEHDKRKDEAIIISNECVLPEGWTAETFLKTHESNLYNPDIVNAHYATGYGALARLARVKPLVLSFWGSDIFEYPYLSTLNRRLLLKNILYADAVASTSEAMAKKIKEVYPEYQKVVHVTPFGIDTDLFRPIDREPNERPIIGIVKYLKPIYDIPLLIDAFSIVWHQAQIKPRLFIYGGGPLQNELEERCRELGIQEDVKFFGTIPNTEIAKAINSMDVFVNCSKAESFGVALLEAMACKVPVIATDTEGYREVVEDGVTGVILKDRKPETMAEAIQDLLKNEEKRRMFGENGRKRVVELYDWNKDVIIMENLYIETIKKFKVGYES